MLVLWVILFFVVVWLIVWELDLIVFGDMVVCGLG